MGSENEGRYCTICGGMVNTDGNIRQIEIDGKTVGINCLFDIIRAVKKMNLSCDAEISEQMTVMVSKNNYVPSKKRDAYRAALLAEYKKFNEEE